MLPLSRLGRGYMFQCAAGKNDMARDKTCSRRVLPVDDLFRLVLAGTTWRSVY